MLKPPGTATPSVTSLGAFALLNDGGCTRVIGADWVASVPFAALDIVSWSVADPATNVPLPAPALLAAKDPAHVRLPLGTSPWAAPVQLIGWVPASRLAPFWVITACIT